MKTAASVRRAIPLFSSAVFCSVLILGLVLGYVHVQYTPRSACVWVCEYNPRSRVRSRVCSRVCSRVRVRVRVPA